jgi:hypothetical protein
MKRKFCAGAPVARHVMVTLLGYYPRRLSPTLAQGFTPCAANR